jgi:hypothetical protein
LYPQTNDTTRQKTPSTEVILREGLRNRLLAGTTLTIGTRSYLVLKDAAAGQKSLVTSLYHDKKANGQAPITNAQVVAKVYQHDVSVSCRGRPAGDFALGSGLIALAWSPSAVAASHKVTGTTAPANALIEASMTTSIQNAGQSPSFGPSPASTALRLDGSTVYSMLEEPVTTPACPGICFESWLKVEQAASSTVVIAYRSEHALRAEGSPVESQTFVLGVPKQSVGKGDYDLMGSINGQRFSVMSQAALRLGQWAHFACSAQNTFALKMSGSEYVDLGKAAEWNVSDFSLAFTLRLDPSGSSDQTLFVKGESSTSATPLHVKVTARGQLELSYWAENENGSDAKKRSFTSPDNKPLVRGAAYKVFISRKLVHVSRNNMAPLPVQQVTMRAWPAEGKSVFEVNPLDTKNIAACEATTPDEALHIHGPAQGNDAPLSLAGAPWAADGGLRGIIGCVQFYSSAIPTPDNALALCTASASTKGLIASWSCRKAGGFSVEDDLGRNHGKLRGLKWGWVLTPYEPDHQLSIFVNGQRVRPSMPDEATGAWLAQVPPAGPHQLTLGNVLVSSGRDPDSDDDTRFLGMEHGFRGELDELRIWNTPRTKENVCDSLHTRLTDIPADMAVYLPFDDVDAETSSAGSSPQGLGAADAILADASINCWHLTPLFGAAPAKVPSEAPISTDAPCVSDALGPISGTTTISSSSSAGAGSRGVVISAGPSVAEYGDMQISASGAMEGSYKRAYSYIEPDGSWALVTGFRIGTLKTEWVGQVQTSPILIGYIEGAPPFPADNFRDSDTELESSVRFRHSKACTYSYSSNSEHSSTTEVSTSRGAGAKWEVSAGLGVSTVTAEGEVSAGISTAVDISNGTVNNEVRASTTNINMEIGVKLTGVWKKETEAKVLAGRPGDDNAAADGDGDIFEPSNTGLALVESEVADVFALRLQMRGPIAPLIAYQMRPNPDIPKDRNLVSFEINRAYTKQGCLDGRRGTTRDPDFPPATASAPKDASYYKPVEAYALRERIRRAEEERQGEFERYSLLRAMLPGTTLPQRTRRNICNSYVWTADGGTFQETQSTLDMVQSEVGGNLNANMAVGASFGMELAFGSVMASANVDAMYSTHFNFAMTKERSSEEGFELEVEPCPPVSIHRRDPRNGKLAKRPGAVEAFRWMSFWLEPSVEATDTFFEQVLDQAWLAMSPEPNARLLRELQAGLAGQTGNARTKAWRVLHRCTYVSRVPEEIEQRPAAADATAEPKDDKKSALLAEVACNWLLLQKLEPLARAAQSRAALANTLKPHVMKLFPSLIADTRLYAQVLDFIADYAGVRH